MIQQMNQLYCLDANVLIQAWQKYYSPKLCPDYWEILNKLGEAKRIFIPQHVFEEITRTEDDLAHWVKNSKILVRPTSGPITQAVRHILSNPIHSTLVDNTKGRSLADPWVIAHAFHEKACVVTKEEKVTAANSKKIKIPNVCENMGVRCINDFEFLQELEVSFSCLVSLD